MFLRNYLCFSIVLEFLQIVVSKSCHNLRCSNFVDPVCGLRIIGDDAHVLVYHNMCHLRRAECEYDPPVVIKPVSDTFCNIKRRFGTTRRVTDFSIVGAHQACNHSCPTHCVDTYAPACAQIWQSEENYDLRPMINHCHIDLFSCAVGVNVTIQPLSKCYKNPSGLLFMSQMAAMKSLKLFDEAELSEQLHTVKPMQNKRPFQSGGYRRLSRNNGYKHNIY